MSSKHDAKLVILGASGVGKTCLGLRFVKDQFVAYTASTIGASFLVKEVRLSAVWGQLAVSPGPASCQLEHFACGLRSVRARCHDAKATAAHVAHVAW